MLTHPQFDPIAFSLGPLSVRWYGLMYLIAFVLFVVLGRLHARRRPELGWNAQMIDDLLLYGVIGVIVGGRLGEVLFFQPGYYLANPGEILAVWKGGMSFHGGFLGVCLAIVLYARSQKINMLRLGDLVAPVVPIGLMFGRLANFINGELWGRETTVPWAVRFCNARIEQMYGFCPAGDAPRHPSQLYEAGLEGIVLFSVLSIAIWKFGLLKKPGYITGLFLVGYGVIRALLETVRQPDVGLDNLPLGLTMGMILSVPMSWASIFP